MPSRSPPLAARIVPAESKGSLQSSGMALGLSESRTDGETATYRLFAGDPLPLRHHGDEFELGAEPVTLPIPHQPAEPPPSHPPGREPHRRKIELAD